jgi:hypothetical protein
MNIKIVLCVFSFLSCSFAFDDEVYYDFSGNGFAVFEQPSLLKTTSPSTTAEPDTTTTTTAEPETTTTTAEPETTSTTQNAIQNDSSDLLLLSSETTTATLDESSRKGQEKDAEYEDSQQDEANSTTTTTTDKPTTELPTTTTLATRFNVVAPVLSPFCIMFKLAVPALDMFGTVNVFVVLLNVKSGSPANAPALLYWIVVLDPAAGPALPTN